MVIGGEKVESGSGGRSGGSGSIEGNGSGARTGGDGNSATPNPTNSEDRNSDGIFADDDSPFYDDADDGYHIAGGSGGFKQLLKNLKRIFSNKKPLGSARGGKRFSKGLKKYKSFTKDNFRDNLEIYTGKRPSNADAHHVFPKADEFTKFFQSKGINVNNPRYGTWWESVEHRAKSYEYNEQWRVWISDNQNAKPYEVLDFGRQLMKKYNIPIHF
jgi:hypothetical protein